MRRNILLLGRAGVSIGLILAVLRMTDLNGALAALRDANVFLFVVGMLVMALGLVVRSYKWRLLLQVQGTSVSLMTLLNWYYISMFFNNLFLGTIGGDAFRAYRAKFTSDSLVRATSSVVMDRATGMFAGLGMVLVLGIALIASPSDIASASLLMVLALFGSVMLLLLAVVFSSRAAALCSLLLRRMPRVNGKMQEMISSFRLYGAQPKAVGLALLLSCVQHLGQSFTMYCFVLAVDVDVAFLDLLFVSLVVGLLVIIPVTLNGLGIQEGSYVFYLQKIGVAGPSALVVVFLARSSLILFGLIGALLFVNQGRPAREKAIAAD